MDRSNNEMFRFNPTTEIEKEYAASREEMAKLKMEEIKELMKQINEGAKEIKK